MRVYLWSRARVSILSRGLLLTEKSTIRKIMPCCGRLTRLHLHLTASQARTHLVARRYDILRLGLLIICLARRHIVEMIGESGSALVNLAKDCLGRG